jgi:hypothetical protein
MARENRILTTLRRRSGYHRQNFGITALPPFFNVVLRCSFTRKNVPDMTYDAARRLFTQIHIVENYAKIQKDHKIQGSTRRQSTSSLETIYFVHVKVNASIYFLVGAGNPLMKLNQAFRWLTSSVNPSTSTMQVQVIFNLRLTLTSE